MSIVTLTFDLWPSKSIGFILSLRLRCLLSLMKIFEAHNQGFSLCHGHKIIAIYVHCDLDLWPLTFKINRVYPSSWLTSLPNLMKKHTMVYIMFTRSKCETSTDRTTAALPYPLHNAFQGDALGRKYVRKYLQITNSDTPAKAKHGRQTDKVIPVRQIRNAHPCKTRAPRDTDRSPEYNEHFCYKLDSRVKN